VEGSYCLAMAMGREIFGFPKKIGPIQFNRTGEEIQGWAEPHGVRLLQLKARACGSFNSPHAVIQADGEHVGTEHALGLSVLVDGDKGAAIAGLRLGWGADAVVFFGDDTTDEDVFATLGEGDVGVKVGDGPTLAGYRVSDPAEVGEHRQRCMLHERQH